MRHLQDPGKILAQVTRPQVREPRHVDRVPGFFFASSQRFPPAGDKHGPWIAPGPAPRSPDRVPQPRRISACPARIAVRGPGLSGHFRCLDRRSGGQKIAGGAACRYEVKDHVFHKQYVIF